MAKRLKLEDIKTESYCYVGDKLTNTKDLTQEQKETLANKICLTLKRLRERAGLTQRQVAQALQISNTYVSHWERGARLPPPKYRAALAALLEADERALLQAAWESHRMREEKRPARAAAAELKA